MQEQFENQDEVQIDLLDLIRVIWKKWWLVVLCFVIGASTMGAYTKIFVTPQYSASSTIYIVSGTANVSSGGLSLSLSQQLTADFILLAKSRPVLQEVSGLLGGQLSYKQLAGCVSVENPEDTHMLKIIARHPDPVLARDIANKMSSVVAGRVSDVMGTTEPSIMESAITPTAPVTPNLKRSVMLGGLAGAALVIIALTILYILDDTIRNAEDVKKYLQVDTLAVFPESGRTKKRGPRY